MLFNIFQKNYILISYYTGKFSKLYDYQKNDSFIKDIYGTKNYETKSMIPWKHKNKWYIIDISYAKVYINNLFEDECYAELKMRGVNNCLNGFIYSNKYLYVSSGSHIIIFDLINKKGINNIEVFNGIRDMLLLDDNYGIVFNDKDIYALNIKENKIIGQSYDYYLGDEKYKDVIRIKKIKLNDIGQDCLVFQENSGLFLYQIK